MLQYDAQRTGNVSGIAPETPTLLWQSGEKTSGCIQAGPIVSGDKVYISTWWSSGMGVKGNGTDALYCLNESTGVEIWNNTGVYGASTAAIADDKLFVGTQRGNVTCIDAASGEIEWSKKIEENPSWYGVASSPLVVDDMVYVLSFSDGTLHTFSFDGAELGNFSTGGEILGLQVSDIDFTSNIISVRRSISRGIVSAPKTENSARDVPLFNVLKP
ncbi:MAG TPA: hypothetical protein EYP28_03130 [Methanophagales archaeon]|nr:hypothetical protein [Methanophagales archaeon]